MTRHPDDPHHLAASDQSVRPPQVPVRTTVPPPLGVIARMLAETAPAARAAGADAMQEAADRYRRLAVIGGVFPHWARRAAGGFLVRRAGDPTRPATHKGFYSLCRRTAGLTRRTFRFGTGWVDGDTAVVLDLGRWSYRLGRPVDEGRVLRAVGRLLGGVAGVALDHSPAGDGETGSDQRRFVWARVPRAAESDPLAVVTGPPPVRWRCPACAAGRSGRRPRESMALRIGPADRVMFPTCRHPEFLVSDRRPVDGSPACGLGRGRTSDRPAN